MGGVVRKARLKGDRFFEFMGDMTIVQAAEKFVRELNARCDQQMATQDDQTVIVEVIDWDTPDHIYDVNVQRFVQYKAVGLRGNTDQQPAGA